MKKQLVILTTMAVSLMLTPMAMAAKIEVIWTDPDSYRDIYSGNESRKHFRARVFRALEKHLSQLAAKLPEQQTLKINVTDLDLAGDVRHGSLNQIRIVKQHYFPRLKFSYQLLESDNTVISEQQVNIKDTSFMMSAGLRYRNHQLSYEKKMLDHWFSDTFSSVLVLSTPVRPTPEVK